jgi:hypothetical protein
MLTYAAATTVMEDEGEVGAYNRANRSMHHMVENFGTQFTCFTSAKVLASMVQKY